MNSATELIDWFWSEIGILKTSNIHYFVDDDGPCQCGTEEVIEDSTNPDQMRSFLVIGVLIDQMMWTHNSGIYSSFRSVFRYPKLHFHQGSGMASPNWFAYTIHGFDKKVNWSVVSDVAQILLNDLYQWFKREGSTEELSIFQEQLKQEVSWEFESVNKEQLMPIIEQVH